MLNKRTAVNLASQSDDVKEHFAIICEPDVSLWGGSVLTSRP